MKYDFAIVGAGIAGSTLAMELSLCGKKVKLIDWEVEHSASRAAAGLVNPIVPKRVSLTWRADEIFPSIPSYFQNIETLLDAKFYYPLPMIQIFSNEEEQFMWKQKAQKEELAQYLTIGTTALEEGLDAPFGYCNIHHCGRLDTQAYLLAIKNHFLQSHSFESIRFEYHLLKKKPNGVWNYSNWDAENVIFCEGEGVLNNPWFCKLPLIPVAGDIITAEGKAKDRIYKKKHWLIPTSAGSFLGGSNFIWDPQTMDEETGAAQIELQLKKWAPITNMTSHIRANRPTVSDRRPLLGSHPLEQNLHIFNGLGTKGCSLITSMVPIMANYLVKNTPLPKEVNISRFSL